MDALHFYNQVIWVGTSRCAGRRSVLFIRWEHCPFCTSVSGRRRYIFCLGWPVRQWVYARAGTWSQAKVRGMVQACLKYSCRKEFFRRLLRHSCTVLALKLVAFFPTYVNYPDWCSYFIEGEKELSSDHLRNERYTSRTQASAFLHVIARKLRGFTAEITINTLTIVPSWSNLFWLWVSFAILRSFVT